MIVLDTNVISELMRPMPAPIVLSWFAQQDGSELFLTTITEAELRTGVAYLPAGQRRDRLIVAINAMLDQNFTDRLLSFDSLAAQNYAVIAADRRIAGKPISQSDCQIAAIARTHRATIATRNVRDFIGTGIAVTNPWADQEESRRP